MIIHQVFAQISERVIKNIIVCDDYDMANWLAKAQYGDNGFAVNCYNYPCKIGDRYDGGFFYDKETDEKLDPINTSEMQIKNLSAKIEYLLMMTGIVTEMGNE
jgi:hypothetical protein